MRGDGWDQSGIRFSSAPSGGPSFVLALQRTPSRYLRPAISFSPPASAGSAGHHRAGGWQILCISVERTLHRTHALAATHAARGASHVSANALRLRCHDVAPLPRLPVAISHHYIVTVAGACSTYLPAANLELCSHSTSLPPTFGGPLYNRMAPALPAQLELTAIGGRHAVYAVLPISTAHRASATWLLPSPWTSWAWAHTP